MSSNVLQPNPPHQPALPIKLTTPTSCLPEMPFCNPPKNPIFFITVFPNQGFIYFSPSYVGSFGFFLVVLVRVSQRKQESKKFLLPYFSSHIPFIIFFLPCPCCFSLSSPFIISFLSFSSPISLCLPPFLSLPLILRFWVFCESLSLI